MAKLTDKQEMFCQEYLIDLNATQAAIRAGYSKKTARDIACENLAKPNIQARIAELKESRSNRIEITSDEVLQELKNFVYSDITETMNLTFKQIKELPIELRRMIAAYKKTETKFDGGSKVTYEIKFIDKMKAFEMVNRHIGFYEADNKQGKTDINLPPINIVHNNKDVNLGS